MKDGFAFEVLPIVGEQVSFAPTKLSPQETAIVEFDRFYVPEGLSKEDTLLLKNTMKYIFSNKEKYIGDSQSGEETEETTRDVFPPCQEKEKKLVLQSLLHRKRLLQQQLFDLGVAVYPEQLAKKLTDLKEQGKLDALLRRGSAPLQGRQTALSETHLRHWLALDSFIRNYDKQALCLTVSDISYDKIQLDLSDDKIKELLQQFVFFMLQGSHPLKEYKKTDPTAPAFIARLSRNPLKEQFPGFLNTYKSNKLPIAPVLARVLEATDLDPSSMREEIKREIDQEKKKLLVRIKEIIPSTDPLWRTISDPNDILRILDALREKNQMSDEEIRRLTSEIESLDSRLKACEKTQAALLLQKQRLQEYVEAIESDLHEAEEREGASNRIIDQLRREKRELEERVGKIQDDMSNTRNGSARNRTLERERQALLDRIARIEQSLTDRIERMQSDLTDAQSDLSEKDARIESLRNERRELQERIEKLQADIEDSQGKDARITQLEEEKRALQERLEKLQTELEDLRETTAVEELREEKDEAIRELNRRINALSVQIRDCLQQKTQKQSEIEQIRTQNQALQEEVNTLYRQVQDMEEILQRAEENIDDLRREHQAALAVEKARTVAAETARVAATRSAEEATAKFAAQTGELAKVKESLASAKEAVQAKDAALAELNAELQEKEAGLANTRDEIAAKTAEATRLSTELAAAQRRIQELNESIDRLRDTLRESQREEELTLVDIDEQNAEIESLKRQVEEFTTRQTDLQTALTKCQEEKRSLELSASGAAQNTAVLTGKLRVAEEEKARALAKVGELEASLRTARDQVEFEKTRAQEAESTIRKQQETIEENEESIHYFEKDIADRQGELNVLSKKAATAEKKVAELEKQVASVTVEKEQQLDAARAEFETRLQSSIDTVKSTFQDTLRKQKEDLENEFQETSIEQIGRSQREYEATLKQQKKEYEKTFAVIQRIARWIDSGEESNLEELQQLSANVPQATSLRTIVRKLMEQPAASSVIPKGQDSTINICYIVFLTAFLWQTHFPPLPAEPPATQEFSWHRQKLLQSILPAVFQGGSKPQGEAWATPTSSSYSFRQGVYRDLETRSAGQTTKHEFAGKLYNEISIIRRYLNIFNKIARALESPSSNGSILGLDALDSIFLDEMQDKLKETLVEFKDVYRTPTFQLETSFPTMIADALLVHQPLIQADVLDRYLVKTPSGYRVQTKGARDAPSLLNYATIFYSFLVVIRDYLNHIEGTVYAQCPLPTILRKTKQRMR